MAFIAGAVGAVLRLGATPLKSQTSWSRAFYDDNGRLLRLTLSKDEKFRQHTSLADFPSALIETFLFKEDRYFYWHWGVNPWALVRAGFQTYTGGGQRIGASTITMQLARMHYKIHSRHLMGKLRQIGAALWLETLYSKNEILEAYLNLLPFGGNIEGAGTASLLYFTKPPQRLNRSEIFSLVVIPQSPRLRTLGASGELQANHDLTISRHRLFQQWEKENIVSPDDRWALQIPLKIHNPKDLPFLAPHFISELLRQDPLGHKSVVTTLHWPQQALLENKIRNYVQRKKPLGVNNAAAMLVNWTTNEVKALVGSADFFSESLSGQVNGTRAFRSPGSTLKPFAYALALDQGLIHPLSLLKDVPTSFGSFDPENFDHEFQGPVSAQEALIHSRNLPAVTLTSQLQKPSFYEFLQSFQWSQMQEASFYGLSTVLGGFEMTMEDIMGLYSMLARQGEWQKLKYLQSEDPETSLRVLSPEAGFLILDMLKKTPRPVLAGGSPWAKGQSEIAWKTGTSHGFRDAWTFGIFGPYVLGVWLGNFDGSSNPAFMGRELAAPLFFEIAEALKTQDRSSHVSAFEWKSELNIKRVKVCSVSGKIPGPHCGHLKETLFIPGKSPIAGCDLHREVEIDPATGLRSCPRLARPAHKKIFEYWTTDLLKIFAKAGMPRRTPPAWHPDCQIQDRLSQGEPPQILSPRQGIKYSLRATTEASQVHLSASAEADVEALFWFVDDSYVGQSKPRENLFWTLKAGHHKVRVLDDQGRSEVRGLEVLVVE